MEGTAAAAVTSCLRRSATVASKPIQCARCGCVSAHVDHFRMDSAMILDMANRVVEDLNEVENILEMLRGSFAGLVLHVQTLNRVVQAWHSSEP